MDFKSLIKKFENPKKAQQPIRYSTREPINKDKESKKELFIESNAIKDENNNDIISQIYSNSPEELNINENIDNHRKTMGISGNNKVNNSFLSKINMFESKKNKDKNENKKEFVFDRHSLASPFMSDLDNQSRKNTKKNNEIFWDINNITSKEELDNKNKEKTEEQILNDGKIKNEKDTKINEDLNNNNIINNENEKIKKEENIKTDDDIPNENNEEKEEDKVKEINSNKIIEKLNTEKKEEYNDNNIDINNKKDDEIREEISIVKEEKKEQFNTNENPKLEEIKNKEERNEEGINENEEINKESQEIDIVDLIENNENNKNKKEEDDNKYGLYNNLYENLEEVEGRELKSEEGEEKEEDKMGKIKMEEEGIEKEDEEDKIEKVKMKEEEKIVEIKNIEEKEEINEEGKMEEKQIEIKDEEKKEDKKEIKEDKEEESIEEEKKEEEKEKNINKEIIENNNIIEDKKEEEFKDNKDNKNEENNNIENILEENLDITKIIKSKENLLTLDNKNSVNYNDEEENLDNYFNGQNNNNGLGKTFSNIELTNQKSSLYEEDESNDTLIKLSEKEKPKNKKSDEEDLDRNIYEDSKVEKNDKEKNNINIQINLTNLNNVSNSEKTKQMNDLFEYDENEELYKKFNSEDFPIRRYDFNTIESGKKFFKFRFIKSKVENYLKFSVIPNLNNKLFLDKSLSSSGLGHNRMSNSFIRRSLTNKSELSISNMNNYDKEKEIRVYSSEFLKLVEKSIFSFNLKKFKESYGYLKKNRIIYNPSEYGEFLLVVSGFDKNIMGEFLSKNHFPNDKKEVLNSFTNSINVEYPQKKLLECLRILLSRVNLPKDANLILEIINSFSLHYFNENKDNNNFFNIYKSSDNIYLLFSTILALNTMLIRTDIKNMNVISKEEFIQMNKNIDSNVIENIYLELKNEPLSMIDDDYNQNIYKKLSNLVIEKTKIEVNNINDIENTKKFLENNNNIIIEEDLNKSSFEEIKNQRRMTFSSSQNFEMFTQEDKKILSRPIKFLKFSGNNSSHYREFLVYDNNSKLIWAKSIDPKKVKGNIHFIMINDIINVFNGINHSEALQKYFNSNKEKEKNNFITIVSSTRQIDLKADNLQSALSWFKALKSLVLKIKNKEEKKNEKQMYINTTKIKSKIENIWKNSILAKWGDYGDYLLFKVHEKKNDLYNLKLVDKNITSTTQINEEKITIVRRIELLSKEIDNKKKLSENDFFALYDLGLPFFVRRKIWKFLIGNPCNISQILYNSYITQVENVNFDVIDIKYHENVNEVFSCDYIINQMVVDIVKIKDLFLCELISKKLEQNLVMLETFKIIRVFFMIRNDLTYNKNIIPLIFIFLILGENEYNTFCNIFNLICGTNIIKYLLGDEQFIKSSVLFFNNLIKEKVPRVFEHFKKLEITTELYLIPWFEEIFTSTLNYTLLLRVLDLFLLNGDYILYQVGLAIINIQEEDILNSTISEIFKILRRFPYKYKEEGFMEYMNQFSYIKQKYFSWNKENILGEQKQLLYQDFYIEEE